MAKASLTLPDGTVVQIEGTTEEVEKLLQVYGGSANAGQSRRRPTSGKKRGSKAKKSGSKKRGSTKKSDEQTADLSEIVNLVKDCDEAEDIERRILDRTSNVDRTLLPLYIVHEHMDNAFGLSSGEVSKVTTDLGIPISQPNASRTLSGTAARYVMGNRVRKKGQMVRYKLTRRGLQSSRPASARAHTACGCELTGRGARG